MDGTPDDNFSLSSVFSQSYFVIPEYQRDYAWNGSNVEDLLDDIEFVYQQNNDEDAEEKVNHYFGTLVLEERGSVEPTDFEDYDVFGIVDGQQRLATVAIAIAAIIDEMADIASNNQISDDISSTINERKSDIGDKYVEYQDIERIQLGGLAEDAYESVILGNRSAESYLQQNDLVDAERKIANAKSTVRDRLKEWKNERFKEGDSTDYAGYYKFLNSIVKILTQRFEVNIKIVEDVDEAARMFKVINDRGRDLRLHDKVRSHLVYCASQSDSMNSERHCLVE